MLEVSNVTVPLEGGLPEGGQVLRAAAAEKLNIPEGCIASVRIVKKSVDARKKTQVHFVMTLDVTLVSESQEMSLIYVMGQNKDMTVDASAFRNPSFVYGYDTKSDVKVGIPASRLVVPSLPQSLVPCDYKRPVVVGTGPAGLFAALYLAQSGLRPLIIERGASVDERVLAVEHFNETGELNPATNIQFGEGGAGTFSDGKLTTNTKNPLTKTVLDWFVQAGAPADILVEAKPHVGTDKLRAVVKNMREQIVARGGQVLFNHQLVDLAFSNEALTGVVVQNEQGERQEIPASAVILACGHSARDTFELLQEKGLMLQRKAFSVGVRIEHPQSMINAAQYGAFASHPALGAADYKLSTHLPNGRGVYTFCMCPGGQVVAAASEEGGVVVNGMSVHARDGENANSAVLVGVNPDDFAGEDPLAGVAFQRELERAAYHLAQKNGGVPYAAPAQRVGDFLSAALSKKGKKKRAERAAKHSSCEPVVPTYARGVAWSDLHECLPPFVTEALEQALPVFDRKLHGFAAENAVMTAVETRSSSPVRVVRDRATLQAFFAEGNPAIGVYPCGEGAGYAGGIMSAAVDGLRVAQQLTRVLSPIDLQGYVHASEPAGASTRFSAQEPAGLRSEAPQPSFRPADSCSEAPQPSFRPADSCAEASQPSLRSVPSSRVDASAGVPAELRSEASQPSLRPTPPSGDNSAQPSLHSIAAFTETSCSSQSASDSALQPGTRNEEAGCGEGCAASERNPASSLRDDMAPAVTFERNSAESSRATAGRAPAATYSSKQRRQMMTPPASYVVPVAGEEQTYVDETGARFTYVPLANGTLRLLSCENATDQMICAAYIDGKLVSEIDSRALLGMNNVRVLALPPGVQRAQSGLLRRISNIELLALPDAMGILDTALLASLSQVGTLQLPSMLARIPVGLFRVCSIHTLRIGAGTREVVQGAFANSTLERVEIDPENPWLFTDGRGIYRKEDNALIALATPVQHYEVLPGCTRICNKAFANMSAVEFVELPNSVTDIESFAFFRAGLYEFVAPASLERIERKAFSQCDCLHNVRLNEGLLFIGEEAFAQTALQAIELPASVRCIESRFCGMPAVPTASSAANAVATDVAAADADGASAPVAPAAEAADSKAPQACSPIPRVCISPDNTHFFIDDSQGLYAYTEHGLVFKELLNASVREYELDPRTREIAPAAFARQTKLVVVELPETLEVIGARAFLGCSALVCVEGSESLRSIEDGAFIGTALQSLYFPATLESLGRSALLLREGTSFSPPRMVSSITVNPHCRAFFFEDDFLCQRLPEGGVAALLYAGCDNCVRIPANATEVRAYCLVNVEKIMSVETHDGIELYETDCFLNKDVVQTVRVNLKNHPIEGHRRMVLCYPNNATGRDALRQSFASQSFLVAAKFGLRQMPRFASKEPAPASDSATASQMVRGWDAAAAFSHADAAMYWCQSTLRMMMYALNRLYDPLFLSDEARGRFEPLIVRRLQETVTLFAKNSYLRGFDQLVSLGFITRENVVKVIDIASEANNVEVTGHLFELRRRCFSYDVMSEFDL